MLGSVKVLSVLFNFYYTSESFAVVAFHVFSVTTVCVEHHSRRIYKQFNVLSINTVMECDMIIVY